FAAALVAVLASFMFPLTIQLKEVAESLNPPDNIVDVLKTLLMSVVDNPVRALLNANYIGILAWAVGLGIALRHAQGVTKDVLADVSMGLSYIVRVVIRLAPIGIFGLVASTI